MKILKQFKKAGLFLLFLSFLSATTFAQTYVSVTNGDDLTGNGSALSPYKTITKGITVVEAAGSGTVVVEPGSYGEALTIAKAISVRAEDFGSTGAPAVITTSLTVATAADADVVSFGETGLPFNLTNLTLTKGVLNIAAANVNVATLITRTAGTINTTPTVTNIGVTYDGLVDITAGAELPADIGSGVLTSTITATKVLTLPNALTTSGGVVVTTGDVTFNNTLTLEDATIANNGTDDVTLNNVVVEVGAILGNVISNGGGNLTVNGTLSFVHDGTAFNYTGTIVNAAGDLTLTNGFTAPFVLDAVDGVTKRYPLIDVTNGAGNLTASGAITAQVITNAAGAILVTGGTATDLTNNTAAGVFELAADFELSGTTIGNNNATAVVKLNANTLTLSNDAAVLTNAGTVISTTAATIGSGTLAITGTGAQAAGIGELPNISIASAKALDFTAAHTVWGTVTNAGTLTLTAAATVKGNVVSSGTVDVNAASTIEGNLTSTGAVDIVGAGITVEGNYAQNVGGTLLLGANTFTIQGDWFRNSNVVGDVTYTTGVLDFTGTESATFTPGAQLELYDVAVNKTAADDVVTLAASIVVNNDFTIATGAVNLADYHIRMEGVGGTFTNNSGGYQTAGIGFVIVDHGAGVTNLTGSGTFSNLDIRGGATAILLSDVDFSGILNLRNGDLDLSNFDMTLTSDVLTVPVINRYTTAGLINATDTDGIGPLTPGTVAVGASVVYDLNYYEATAASGLEWLAAGIRNLSVSTTAGTITGPAAGTTITGKLLVESGETLNLNTNAVTMTGGAIAHSVLGTVTNGGLVAQGDASSISGSTDVADARVIDDLTIDVAAGETFNVINIEQITGDLTVNDGSSTVSLVDDATANTDGQLAGTVTLVDGTLTLAIADEADGDDGSAEAIGTNLFINDGTLVLASDITVVGTTDLGNGALETGSINLGSYDLTLGGVFTHNGVGTLTGSGDVVVDYSAGVGNFVLTTDLSISNLVIDAANAVTVTSGDLEVSNSYTHTSGTFDINGNDLEISGDAIHYTAGSLTDGTGNSVLLLSGGDVVWGLEGNMTLVNLTVNATSVTISDADGDATSDADQVILTGDLTQTAGDITLDGKISFEMQGDFTRTAGVWTMGTGSMILNGIGTIAQGDGFAVDNLKVSGALATFADGKAWAINKSLILAAQLDPGDDAGTTPAAQLTLADGITVERQSNAAKLDNAGLAVDAIYVGQINLAYTTAGPITTSGEVPAGATVLDDVDISVGVVLADDLTVNGTLTVNNTTVTEGAFDINMAAKSTVHVVEYVVGMFGQPLVPAGLLNVTFEQSTGAVTADDDILDKDFSIGTLTVDGALDADDLTMHDNITVANLSIIDDGDVLLATNALSVTGNVTKSSTGEIENGSLNFTGATAGTIALSADWAVLANVDVTLNKTNNSDVVTLTGGNLDFASTPNDLVLTKGVLETDATSKVILKQSVVSLQPTQGFTRTSGVIAGNVEKYIDNSTTIDISQVEYPTGDADGNYRPANFYFTTAPLSSINLLVDYNDVSPEGVTGLPMTLDNQTITNYPDFSWKVLSDVSLAPSYQFDVEFQAEGYSDYLLDGIGNVRLIRRGDGNTANPWVLQGLEANYDNSTIAADWPLVKVIDATGGITSQGALFTYSQANKPPVVTKTATVNSTVADVSADVVTISEDTDTLVVSYVVTDPDIGDAATTSAVVPTGATWDADAKTITWTPGLAQVGEYLAIITATDTYSQVTKDTLTITVVNTPSFAEAPADSVNVTEGITTTYQYTGGLEAGDPDSLTFTYTEIASGAIDADSVTIVDTTGVLSVSPALGTIGDEFTVIVTATDNTGGSVADTTVFTVVKLSQAPVFAVEMADTNVDANSLLTLDFGPNASDPDGDTLTFTHTLLLDGVAVADSIGNGAMTAAGVYTWTPAFNQSGEYVLVANASDGALSADDSVNVTVNFVNTPPVWVAEMPNQTVFLGDTLTFTYNATDANNDSVTYAFNGAYPPAATLDAATGEFSWKPATAAAFPVVIKVKATDGTDSVTTFAEVVVEVTTVNLSGVVTYNGGELLENVEVTLSDGQKDTTGADGAYLFTGLAAGDYTVTAAKADQVGGALASDALETQLYIVNPDSTFLATDMQKLAADVVGVGNITSSDALAILNRSVGIDDFQVADWLFESKTISVATTNKVQDLKGIAAGDARGDYSPAAGLAKTSNMAVNNGEVLNIKKQAEFELPISMAELTEVGSYTMKLQYAADKVEFLGATTSNGGMLVSNVKDNVISIAWMNLDSKVVKVKEGGALATLKFKATELFSKSDELSLELLAGSELTDRMAKNINAGISIPVVAIGIPDVFALRQNYPNPFNPSTTIQYDLPENGKVTLTIYNSLGQTVGTLVNQKQVAGAYDVNFNASNLASGVYLYRVTVEGTKNFVMTKKMILMK